MQMGTLCSLQKRDVWKLFTFQSLVSSPSCCPLYSSPSPVKGPLGWECFVHRCLYCPCVVTSWSQTGNCVSWPGVEPVAQCHSPAAYATLFAVWWHCSSRSGCCFGQRAPTTGFHQTDEPWGWEVAPSHIHQLSNWHTFAPESVAQWFPPNRS